MKKIFLIFIFSNLIFSNEINKVEIEIINNPNNENQVLENDDFLKIHLQKRRRNIQEFYYFSRWHKYLQEVEKEKYRRQEYENQLAQYESDLKRYNEEIQNEKINEIPEGEAIDVEKISENNFEDE